VRSTSANDVDAFADLIDACVAAIVRDEDWQRFSRSLEEMLRAGKVPSLPVDPEAARMLGCALGRTIWNATPLPGNGFRPRPIPSPGRNDRCLVGLACKHKHCCGGMPAFPRVSSDEIWASLCKALPAATLQAAAAAGKLPPAALGAAARRLLAEARDPDAARRLLEPLFRGNPEALDERFEEALDVLCDAYDLLEESRKKQVLLERIARTASPGLRVPALQRLATVLSDADRYQEAWAAFREAQRLEPDHPGLASLEVTMLLAEGRPAEAAERAAFWSRRLRRLGFDDPAFLGHLDALAKGGGAAAGEAFLKIAGEAPNRLHVWLARHDARPVPMYRIEIPAPLDPGDEAAFTRGIRRHLQQIGASDDGLDARIEALRRQLGEVPQDVGPGSGQRDLFGADDAKHGSTGAEAVLAAPASLAAMEEAWRKVYRHGKPTLVSLSMEFARDPWGEGANEWLGFLEAHAEAFDSLDILDDLATALDGHPLLGAPWLQKELLDPLLARATAIVDAALATRSGTSLPWAIVDNRPTLRLLARRAYRQLDEDDPLATESLGRMLALNPTDNHGLRAPLVNLLLRRGLDDAGLELIERYPEDLEPAIRFGAVLAWYRKGDRARAALELAEAVRFMPLVPEFLIPARKAQPKLSKLGVTAGGPDEAWLYRAEMREAWAGVPGLLDWLKRSAR